MDFFLQNIDLIALKKRWNWKIKKISQQDFLKSRLKKVKVLREKKDYDKGRKEKS